MHAGVKRTRRDAVLVNQLLLPAEEGFRVEHNDKFPTHSPVHVRIATKKMGLHKRKLRKPDRAAEVVAAKIVDEVQPIEGRKEQKEARKHAMADLRVKIGVEIALREPSMEATVQNRNTKQFWDLIPAVVEVAFVRYLGLHAMQANRMRGRNRVTIETKEDLCVRREGKEYGDNVAGLRRETGQHNAQTNRLPIIAKIIMSVQDKNGCRGADRIQNENTRAAYFKQATLREKGWDAERKKTKKAEELATRGAHRADANDGKHLVHSEVDAYDKGRERHRTCFDMMRRIHVREHLHAAAIIRAAEMHKKATVTLQEAAAAQARNQALIPYEDGKRGIKHISRKLDKTPAAPLKYVNRDGKCTEGSIEGTLTTDRGQIDAVVGRTWQRIYEGNVTDMPKQVVISAATYANCMFRRTMPYALGHITGNDAWRSSQAIEASTGGMDGWEPTEMKLLSCKTCKWVAVLLQLIEGGADWPESSRHAKIAYLEIDGHVLGDVMSYRPLTLMAPIYRRWASMRLRALEPWAGEWVMPEMYAGVAQQTTVEATYQVMADLENPTLEGTPFCGAAVDIFTLFGQILRNLFYLLLEVAGMPKEVLETYRRFLEGLVTYNLVAGGLGHGLKRRCEIPQGCPFSMMPVAMLMRPWIGLIRTLRVAPKTLADDVMIIAKRWKMLSTIAHALTQTRVYLQSMGGRIASNKSFSFASTTPARAWPQSTWWEKVQASISVVKDFRCLGAHLSTQNVKRHDTPTERVYRALEQLRKLKYLNVSARTKAKAIQITMYPGLLYGIQVNHINERHLAMLSAAVIDAITANNDHMQVGFTRPGLNASIWTRLCKSC